LWKTFSHVKEGAHVREILFGKLWQEWNGRRAKCGLRRRTMVFLEEKCALGLRKWDKCRIGIKEWRDVLVGVHFDLIMGCFFIMA
jgi:hypothetical protein